MIDIEELKKRLVEKAEQLDELANHARRNSDSREMIRLKGKASGVRLAIVDIETALRSE